MEALEHDREQTELEEKDDEFLSKLLIEGVDTVFRMNYADMTAPPFLEMTSRAVKMKGELRCEHGFSQPPTHSVSHSPPFSVFTIVLTGGRGNSKDGCC